MSGLTQSLPTYTIEVGNPNSFTNDATIDISAFVNAELKNAPTGYHIDLVFNPGIYGETTTILLPSNTSVIGNDATLGSIWTSGSHQYGALMANAGAYYANGGYNVENDAGVSVLNPYLQNMPESMFADPQDDVINTNISVEGMTFNETGYTTNGSNFSDNSATMFGTWFTNAEYIDVQNNTYIGGTDGTANVNVINSVVANNIAIGVTNAAYDNWNGPTDTTIEDNTSFMSAAQNTGWSVLINSDPSGDPANPGNATNNAVIDNTFSTDVAGQQAIEVTPLNVYGPTEQSGTSIQGNVDTQLGSNDGTAIYVGQVNDSTVSNNLILNQFQTGSNENVIDAPLDSSTSINGNEVANQSATSTIANFIYSSNSTSSDNVNLSTNPNTYDILSPQTAIISPPDIIISSHESDIEIPNISISSNEESVEACVTISCVFGALNFSAPIAGVQITNTGSTNSTTLSGSLSLINNELADLMYEPNASQFDDSIEIQVDISATDSITTGYIPIIFPDQDSLSSVTTINSTFLNSSVVESALTGGQQMSASSSLTGDIIVASTGNNQITMGSMNSMAFLGSGDNTVAAGNTAEYIAAGVGSSLINLDQQGEITVVGGAGNLQVESDAGNNVVESGSSNATINSTSGNLSVYGGVGNVTLNGSGGTNYISTLPESNGTLDANLSSGSSTVLALSGNDTITTGNASSNLIYLGTGNCELNLSGNDTINCGSGNSTINLIGGDPVEIMPGSSNTDVRIDSVDIILQPNSADISMVANSSGNFSGFSNGLMTRSTEVYGADGSVAIRTSSGETNIIDAGRFGSGSTSILSYGNDNIVSDGETTVSALAGSTDNIKVDGGTLVFSNEQTGLIGSSSANISLSSGDVTIQADGTSYITLSFLSGDGRVDYINNSMVSQTVGTGNTGSATISGGIGGGYFVGGSAGNNSLIGGAGIVTLVGGGNGDYLEACSELGTNQLFAGSGNETLCATQQTRSNNFTLSDDSSGFTSTSGSGVQDFLIQYGSGCDETITGSTASSATNIYNFTNTSGSGGGNYTITDFSSSNSQILVSGISGSAQYAISEGTISGELSTILSFSGGLNIELEGVAASALSLGSLQNGSITIT